MAERTEADIAISAKPAAIMAVIADTAHYPDWCPGVRSAEVESSFPDGNPQDVQMVFDSGPINDTHRYRYDSWSETEVRWHLLQGSTVTSLTGIYECTPGPDGTTVVHYRLSMHLAVPIIGALRRRAEKVIVRTALQGLKDQVESL